jgi:hypothetical protein
MRAITSMVSFFNFFHCYFRVPIAPACCDDNNLEGVYRSESPRVLAMIRRDDDAGPGRPLVQSSHEIASWKLGPGSKLRCSYNLAK